MGHTRDAAGATSHLVSHAAGGGQPDVNLQAIGAAAEAHAGLVLDVLRALH